MKILTTVLVVPLLAAFAVLPAQDKKPSKKTSATPEKIVDSKFTKNDPAIRAIDKAIKKVSVGKDNAWKMSLKAPPKQEFQGNMDYFWHVETSEGKIKFRYFADEAPVHVTSGIYLSRLGYYDGLNFHRVIPGFMAQGGCPMGRGTGGPGYFMDGEFESKRKHDKPGLLSMANTGRPRSDGSQFFITFVPTPWLNNKHTIWGEVVDGMDTVQALEKLGSRSGRPSRTPKIVRTWIEVVPKKKSKDGKDGKDGEDGKGGEHGKKEHDKKEKGEHGGGR